MNIHEHRTNNGDDYPGIPLSKWLSIMKTKASYNLLATTTTTTTYPAVVADDATLKQWLSDLQTHQQQHQLTKNGCPTNKIVEQQQEQILLEEEWQTRLRVAIAITKMLCDLHDGIRSRGYSKKFSVENIILDMSQASSSCYSATLKPSSDHGSVVVEWTSQNDMEHLGYVLNAVFGGGENDDSIGANKEEQHKSDDSTRKKRGKQQDHQQQSMENLPLYLSCIVSSLRMTKETAEEQEACPSVALSTISSNASFTEQYANVKQVLHDLQIASAKPEVYLKRITSSSSWNDGKSNQLHIPLDSFYGRKSELCLLLHSLDTVLRFGQPIMVSVSGYAGTGKTALLNQIKSPLEKSGGYMIRGKFDKVTSPNTVIFSALDSFFGKINTSGDVALQAELMSRISDSIGCGGSVLMGAIPNLRTLMMAEEDEEEESNSREFNIDKTNVSHQRWKYLIVKLIKAISDKSRPIAYLFDDLHWCDEVTLDLIQAMVTDPDIRYCIFLASYRINAQESNVTRTLDNMQSTGVRLVSLKVSSIEKESVNSLISETLFVPPTLCQSLSALVHRKTGGSILFCTNFLKSLHEEGMLRFSMSSRKWEYSLNEIRQRKIHADVVKHLSERMARLPNNVQSLLKISACLGFEFDASLLQMAIKGKKVFELLPYAIDSGFLQGVQGTQRYQFSHDEIHLAAYELIPVNKRQSSHLLIGSRIYMNTTSDEVLHKVIYDIVNNMNIGRVYLPEERRIEVASLNLTAGKKAMSSSSFNTAKNYFMMGISLLGHDCWEREYQTTLILHQTASEALYVSGDLDTLKRILDEQLNNATCLDDKLNAYYCLVRYLHTTSNPKEAMLRSLSILNELGVCFQDATPELIYKELVSTKALLNNVTKEDIMKSPRITEPRKLWILRFMNCFMRYAFVTKPAMLPLAACRVISISAEHGYCADSALGFGAYSLAQLNVLHDIEEAYKWAKVTMSFPLSFNAPDSLPRLKCLFYAFTSFWKEPMQASCDALLSTHQDLLLIGDVEFAMTSIHYYCRLSLFSGTELSTVDDACVSAASKMIELTHVQSRLSLSSNHNIVLNLIGNTATRNPFDSLGKACNCTIDNEDDLLEHTISKGKIGVVQAIRFNRLFLAYWFKNYTEAAEMAELYKSNTMMPLVDTYHAFYQGLTAFHFVRHPSVDVDEEKNWMDIGEKALSSFRKWCLHSSWNWENKLLLLEAEGHFSQGNMSMAEEKYKAAIESARKHRFVHEEGLSNELFASFHTVNGDLEGAKNHILSARTCYERWGAFALVDLLDMPGH